ncbi:MAG: hypothetical protein AB8H79_06010 [Myxococcota bacterium]
MYRTLAFALILGIAQPAFAQDDAANRARAAELFDNGSRLYEDGLYEQAIVAFEAAYDISKEPALFFNIANAYERLGKPREALDALNQYRPFVTADKRASLDRRVVALESRIKADEAAALKAPAVVATPAPTLPSAPAEVERKRSWLLPGIGGGLLAAGGIVAGLTYASGRNAVADNDEARWNELRPINNAGIVVAGLGAATATIGFAVPLGGKKSKATAAARPSTSQQ